MSCVNERTGYAVIGKNVAAYYECDNISASPLSFKMLPVWLSVPTEILAGADVYPWHTHEVDGRMSRGDKDGFDKICRSVSWRFMGKWHGFRLGGSMIISQRRGQVFVYNLSNELVSLTGFCLN